MRSFRIWLATVAVVIVAPSLAIAQVNARVEISAAVAGSSATLEAVERQASLRDRVRQQEIAALEVRLADAESRGEAQLAALQVELTAAREALVADLSSRDATYAEEIAVFRQGVVDIASSPAGAIALARFNRGDEIGALAVLDQLRAARDAARRVRADLESAGEARRIANLALDARDRGRLDTAAVIVRFEEVVRLDAQDYDSWRHLSQLYLAAGRPSDALNAAERAEALAEGDEQRAAAMTLAGHVLFDQGRMTDAKARYQGAFELRAAMSDVDRSDVVLSRVGHSLNEVAKVLRAEGDDAFALRSSELSLRIARRVVGLDPDDAGHQYDICVPLNTIGAILNDRGEFAEARSRFEECLGIVETLREDDPASAKYAYAASSMHKAIAIALWGEGFSDLPQQRMEQSLAIMQALHVADPASAQYAGGLSELHFLLGQMEPTGGAQALSRYLQALEITETLYARDATAVSVLTDMAVILDRVAAATLALGDTPGAIEHYERAVEVWMQVLRTDPTAIEMADGLIRVSLALGDLYASNDDELHAAFSWRRAVYVFEDLEARGLLDDGRAAVLEGARARLAALPVDPTE